jgi:hypothetical protein
MKKEKVKNSLLIGPIVYGRVSYHVSLNIRSILNDRKSRAARFRAIHARFCPISIGALSRSFSAPDHKVVLYIIIIIAIIISSIAREARIVYRRAIRR